MELASTLRRQHGVISRRQARACGLSESTVRRLVAARAWEAVFRGVYAPNDRTLTPVGRIWALLLWAGPGATLVGASAGWWWGLVTELPAILTVAVPPGRHPGPPAGVRVVRRRIDGRDRRHHRGVPVVELPLAVLETAVELGGEEGARVMDRALQRRVSLDELRRARSRAVGHRGARDMGRLITLAGDRARSALERLVVQLLTEAGVRGWEVNGIVVLPDRNAEVDILFREAKVAIELKGWAFHNDPASVDADQDRENVLQIAGYLVLQISWWDAVKRPRRTLVRVVDALATRDRAA